MMRRIWLYLLDSTLEVITDILDRMRQSHHKFGHRREADRFENALEDVRRAKRLSDTGVTREEIEHASRKADEGEKNE
jgi:uncharacterized protein YjiS (DUF1127 family)